MTMPNPIELMNKECSGCNKILIRQVYGVLYTVFNEYFCHHRCLESWIKDNYAYLFTKDPT